MIEQEKVEKSTIIIHPTRFIIAADNPFTMCTLGRSNGILHPFKAIHLEEKRTLEVAGIVLRFFATFLFNSLLVGRSL